MKKNENKSGSTLIELMVSLLIVYLIMISWCRIVFATSPYREAQRRAAVEIASGLLDIFPTDATTGFWKIDEEFGRYEFEDGCGDNEWHRFPKDWISGGTPLCYRLSVISGVELTDSEKMWGGGYPCYWVKIELLDGEDEKSAPLRFSPSCYIDSLSQVRFERECDHMKIGKENPNNGYTLVEFLIVALIITVAAFSVGTGFVQLYSSQLRFRERARTLQALCRHFAITQPYVAAGSKMNLIGTNKEMHIAYPKIFSGVACETNRYVQVTNTTLRVTDDGILQSIIHAGKVNCGRSPTNTMLWMDSIFGGHQPSMEESKFTPIENGVLIEYVYKIQVDGSSETVKFAVPVRLRNM